MGLTVLHGLRACLEIIFRKWRAIHSGSPGRSDSSASAAATWRTVVAPPSPARIDNPEVHAPPSCLGGNGFRRLQQRLPMHPADRVSHPLCRPPRSAAAAAAVEAASGTARCPHAALFFATTLLGIRDKASFTPAVKAAYKQSLLGIAPGVHLPWQAGMRGGTCVHRGSSERSTGVCVCMHSLRRCHPSCHPRWQHFCCGGATCGQVLLDYRPLSGARFRCASLRQHSAATRAPLPALPSPFLPLQMPLSFRWPSAQKTRGRWCRRLQSSRAGLHQPWLPRRRWQRGCVPAT